MVIQRTDWAREATLVRPPRLTLALFESAPALDVSRPWVPDHLLPLYGGEGFLSLNASQRLRYNHAYARQLVDEFIWTERLLILAPLKRLCLTRALNPDQSVVLQSFMSDEIHHIECFSHLEDLAIDADQPASKSVLRPPRLLLVLLRLARSYPAKLTFWAPLIEGFEQRALKIAQEYRHDESVDPLFREVFVAHARDEARHCRFDALLATWLQGGAGTVSKTINDKLLATFTATYRSVEWGLDGPLHDLARSHPEIEGRLPQLLAESQALRCATPDLAGPE